MNIVTYITPVNITVSNTVRYYYNEISENVEIDLFCSFKRLEMVIFHQSGYFN